MVRVSSKGNPWHDDLGKFCSKENATFIKCGGKFISYANMTIEEKNRLATKIKKQNFVSFYEDKSIKRNKYAKKISIYTPVPLPKKLPSDKRERKILFLQRKQDFQKARQRFVKENLYHLNHGGQLNIYTDKRGTVHFVSINPKKIYKNTVKNQGDSADFTTNMRAFSGYMVAKYPEKSQWIDASLPPEKQITLINDYCKQNLAELSKPNMYFGTWYDSGTHKISLDISERINDLEAATHAGNKRNEKAIWDVADNKEIVTGGTGTNI